MNHDAMDCLLLCVIDNRNFFSCVTVVERVGHRLFVLAILLHEFQVKKTRWIAEFRLLEFWKMIDDSKLPISYSP
jgi:hypothetical protein